VNAPPLVCLTGDEAYLIDRALAEIEVEALDASDPGLNRQVFDGRDASPAGVASAAKTLPFLGTRRLIIVRNAHLWTAAQWKALVPYLESPNPSTCLVFVAAELDRRVAAAKLLTRVARVVECRKPKERDMMGWARKLAREANLSLSPHLLHALVLRVGPDLQLLSREIEKLRVFAGTEGEVSEADVETLVGDARGTTVFALCDALGQHDLAAAVRALRKLLELSEPPAKILMMIVRHFRQLWIATELLAKERRPNAAAAASLMGVPPFAAAKVLEQAWGWDEMALRDAFERFLRADLSIKTGGAEDVLDGLVFALCSSPRAKRPGRDRGARSSKPGIS
jgi:DNA polymerase-3 subunit delta